MSALGDTRNAHRFLAAVTFAVLVAGCGGSSDGTAGTIDPADTRTLFATWFKMSGDDRGITCVGDDREKRRTVMVAYWWTPETEFDDKANRWVGQPSDAAIDDFLDAACPTVVPSSS